MTVQFNIMVIIGMNLRAYVDLIDVYVVTKCLLMGRLSNAVLQ